jgi:hypothetical protein
MEHIYNCKHFNIKLIERCGYVTRTGVTGGKLRIKEQLHCQDMFEIHREIILF